MEDIANVTVEPMAQSNFLKPLRINFTQNGKKRFWDLVKAHDSVSCILFNTSRQVLMFVKQFRPVVYLNVGMQNSSDNSVKDVDWTKVPGKSGLTIELCAGIVDADRPLNEIIKKEVLEECGYDVPLENFQEIINHRDIALTGNKKTMFYAEFTDAMKVSEGGGLENEGELIDVIEMTVPQVRDYINQNYVHSPIGALFGMLWFLANKAPKNC